MPLDAFPGGPLTLRAGIPDGREDHPFDPKRRNDYG